MMLSILFLAGLSIMFFGYDASVMVCLCDAPTARADSGQSQVNTNPDYLQLMGAAGGSNRDAAAVGGIVSVWFGGFAIGALMVGAFADKIGRLKTIQLGCLWALLGGALQASAQNITWMMFARVIGGIGCGFLNTVVCRPSRKQSHNSLPRSPSGRLRLQIRTCEAPLSPSSSHSPSWARH